MRFGILKTLAASAALLLAGSAAMAQEFTFKLHHLLSAKAPAHTKMLEPWAKQVEGSPSGAGCEGRRHGVSNVVLT